MMAFFLLMWLLNATTEDQRKGLADYFSPNNLLSHASSGTGQPFGGHTVFDQGAMVSDRGAVQVIVGRRPAVQAPDDSDADTPLLADRHNAAEEAGPAGRTDAVPPGSAKVQPANPPAASAGTASATAASATAASATAANSAAASPCGRQFRGWQWYGCQRRGREFRGRRFAERQNGGCRPAGAGRGAGRDAGWRPRADRGRATRGAGAAREAGV